LGRRPVPQASCGIFSLVGHTSATFAANGYGELSMLKASLFEVFILETVLTAFFLVVIMGVTRANGPALLAPAAIGLTPTAIHIMSIPISNTSTEPRTSHLCWRTAFVAGLAVLGGVHPRRRHRRSFRSKWLLEE
jgi:glycerol uptake facilitator-like aquaporin